MMGNYPQPPSPPHLYSQALQLKLYQAFIFSIPTLFSIILFLLFYMFFLKRRTNSTLSSPPSTLPRTFIHGTPLTTLNQLGLKSNQLDKLPMILFNEELSSRDSQCCVCLGEFEMKEELNQIPSCKHMFHVNCIRHWLHSNSTCPLCRCSVVTTTSKIRHSNPPNAVVRQEIENFNQNPQTVSLEQQEQVVPNSTTNIASFSREQSVVLMEGSSSTSICMHINDDSLVLSTNGT